MKEVLLGMFHILPGPLRTLAATLYGANLRRWRYGKETESLIGEAIQREAWSKERWQSWQEERLAYVLHRAATRVPYYRNEWSRRRRGGDTRSFEYLEHWPILTKQDLRANPRSFVADDCTIRSMFHESTSGSTGTPVELWWSHRTVREWYALFEARWRRWHGVSMQDWWAIIGGRLILPARRNHPPFWVVNRSMRQLYMSAYHMNPQYVKYYLDALLRYKIRYLWGYTSSLVALAEKGLASGIRSLGLAVVITNAEPLLDEQRRIMSEAFGAPVRETYGMAEIVMAAGECRAGALHLWPEAGFVEVRDGSQPALHGSVGDLVCTGLLNADMPLIRYQVGDRGAMDVAPDTCACGRTLPRVRCIEGRDDELVYTHDGAPVGRLDGVFKGRIPVREAQIVQDSLASLRIRYVPAEGFSDDVKDLLVHRIQSRMGSVTVAFEALAMIPRMPNGKMKTVICRIPKEEIERLRNPVRSERETR